MKLSSEQLQQVARWFADGASLDEIQKQIKATFDIHMTYLDVRLLVADLPQPVEEQAEAEKDEPDAEPTAPQNQNPDACAEMPGDDAPLSEGLNVAVDPLTPPGALACGSVTFSDGTAGKWVLDQMGRLGLSGLPAGYRPPEADNAAFQPKLIEALRAKGIM